MHDVLLLPSAEADLDDIAIYTRKLWGKQQARRYVATLRFDMEALGEFPRMHPVYESRRGVFHKSASREHLIFCRIGETAVEVIRVLHNRMDVDDAFSR